MSELDIDSQHIAQLQHMGVDLYSPLITLNVIEFAWLDDVLSLLDTYLSKSAEYVEEGSSTFKLSFGHASVSLNLDDKQLQLPDTTLLSESDFKRAVWQTIKHLSK